MAINSSDIGYCLGFHFKNMRGYIMNKPKATWGKIKNWDKLALYHRQLLYEELNPIYRKVVKRHIEPKPGDYFFQMNNTVGRYE